MALVNVIVELTEVKDEYIRQLDMIMKAIRHVSHRTNTVSGTVEETDIPRIRSLPFVRAVYIDQEFRISSSNFVAPEKPVDFLSMSGKFITTGQAIEFMNGADVNGGKGVKVAVLDTGVNSRHPALVDKVIKHIQVAPGDIYDGKFGHGTWVAGAIASNYATIEIGDIRGVAPKAEIINVKILTDDGIGMTSYIIEGIDKALDAGAKVLNMSLASPSICPPPLVNAIQSAVKEGAFVVCAGGNFGNQSSVGCPASLKETISVGSVYPYTNGQVEIKVSSFSPQGVDVVAIGGSIDPPVYVVSTVKDYYYGMAGTSMAAPFVSGLIALLLEKKPDLTLEQLYSTFAKTCVNWKGGKDPYLGYGLINIAGAVRYVAQGVFEPVEVPEVSGEVNPLALLLLLGLGWLLVKK